MRPVCDELGFELGENMGKRLQGVKAGIMIRMLTSAYAELMLAWLSLGMTIWYVITNDTGHFLFFIAAAIPALSMLVMALSKDGMPLHDLMSSTGLYKISVD